MSRLNTKDINGKEFVFCTWRRRWVRLTPEEWVRQQFLHRLVDDYHYPAGRIGVEVAIAVGEAKKRCDAVVYDEQLQPLVLIECKAEHVALTQRPLDQAITYNRQLRVPYLFLHNGPETIVVRLKDCQTVLRLQDRLATVRPLTLNDRALRCQTDIVSDSQSVGQQSVPDKSGCKHRTATRSDSEAVVKPQFLTYIPQWSQL